MQDIDRLSSETAVLESVAIKSIAAAAPIGPSVDQLNDADFAMSLLVALTNMATRSKRRQADLVAALRGAKLVAEPRRVRAALRLLQTQGMIENLVPLSDGGLLLTVTQVSGDQFDGTSQWLLEDAPGDRSH